MGDDEHGWDDDGVFNFEGGCYAKTIDLNAESEPDIYQAISRDALLENVVVDDTGKIDYSDRSITENTRVSYPLYHIHNIVKPVSRAGHPTKVIFLTADAFGVLPPVSILNHEQTKYHFLSGFTAKLAGTERGITEPVPTFSACFGKAFLSLHPTTYGKTLVSRMDAVGRQGLPGEYRLEWHGQADIHQGYPGHHRRHSRWFHRGGRDIVLPIFNLEIPKRCTMWIAAFSILGILMLTPSEWQPKAVDLAERFIKNFALFSNNEEGRALVAAGTSALARALWSFKSA